MLRLVLDHESVYVDLAAVAVNDEYYQELRRLLDQYADDKKAKLTSRILFGTDFPIDLIDPGVDSYTRYIGLFSRTTHLSADEKHQFCSTNPERFLFSGDATAQPYGRYSLILDSSAKCEIRPA